MSDEIFNQVVKFADPSAIPYAPSLEVLEQFSTDQIAKFGEASFDEVVQLTIIRQKIFQESALIAATGGVVATRAMDSLEAQIFAPTDDAVLTTYPVPPEAIGITARAKPITYNIQKVDLDLAETRYFISDDAKLRGASEWLEQDSIKRAAEHLAETKDKHVLTQLIADAPAGNDVAATAVWSSSTATPEDDVASAVTNIITNSNMPSSQFMKPNAFTMIIPVAAFEGVTKLKLIRNIIQPLEDFITTQYKVQIVLSRQPRVESTWPIDTEAIILPTQDTSIGFLGTFDGGGIVPAQMRKRLDRGEDIITREWFRWTTIPEPLDGSTTTNARIAKITGVAA